MSQRKTVRIEDNLYCDIENIAKAKGQSINGAIETACKFYRDYCHMGEKATFINDELLKVVKANMDYLLQQVNHKTNKVLSELAIQSVIQNLIFANELDVNPMTLDEFRKQAIDFLRSNNRVLRLDELTE